MIWHQSAPEFLGKSVLYILDQLTNQTQPCQHSCNPGAVCRLLNSQLLNTRRVTARIVGDMLVVSAASSSDSSEWPDVQDTQAAHAGTHGRQEVMLDLLVGGNEAAG